VNLEDISQPNCYRVLDGLQGCCDIPVWHDDAQGTGLVTLAGLFNALKIVDKSLADVRIFLLGAGASNTTIARLVIEAGADPARLVIADSRGPLHREREDLKADPRFYRKWELAQTTNPDRFTDVEQALRGSDVLISLARPGPDTIPAAWIESMADEAVVFACANPVPEIYPHTAYAAGARVVATGRGDFPNQVNNSLGFPAVLKGALLVRARRITDAMAIAASRSLAHTAERRGITPQDIIPKMDEPGVFPEEAAAVAMQAIEDGVARRSLSREEVLARTRHDILEARTLFQHLMEQGFIPKPPPELLNRALAATLSEMDARGSLDSAARGAR
jgi:malate dehydrogenase (oxaloacetate-decarboxylating)